MATPEWTADIAMDANLARELVAARFPAFTSARVNAYGFGWDNVAYLFDERAVFRFPRRQRMAKLLEREIAILPLVAPLVPARISAPTYVGVASQRFPYAFAGYDLLLGTTACRIALSEAERTKLAIALAAFLRALHAIDPQPLVAKGLPPDELARLDHGKRAARLLERVASIRDRTVLADLDACVAWLLAHPPIPLEDRARTLVHGDLYARHLILSDTRALVGVIDWGDVHQGDPALDLAIAHAFLPASAHDRFRETYGAIDERTWHAARYRAIAHAILEIDYGMREDDAGMSDIGNAALHFIAAALPTNR